MKLKKKKQVLLHDCPIGLFMYEKTLCLKTEYTGDYFIISSGEYFWGGSKDAEQREKLYVTPIKIKNHDN